MPTRLLRSWHCRCRFAIASRISFFRKTISIRFQLKTELLAAASFSSARSVPSFLVQVVTTRRSSFALPTLVFTSFAFPSLAFPSFAFTSFAFPPFAFPSFAVGSLAFTSFSLPSFSFTSFPFTSFAFNAFDFTSFAFTSFDFPSFAFSSFLFTSFPFPSFAFTSTVFPSLAFPSFALLFTIAFLSFSIPPESRPKCRSSAESAPRMAFSNSGLLTELAYVVDSVVLSAWILAIFSRTSFGAFFQSMPNLKSTSPICIT
ncbi:hypothetical protein GGS20DRAFT_91355 [Poronia punctata]|nr:hypothetical protein GGS20DRAFT_91355 [Poronia punctata]